MTTSKKKTEKEELDDISAALDGAKVLHIKVLQAQRKQAVVAQETADELEAAKSLYETVVEEQRLKTVDANGAAELAMSQLVEFQATKSEELGIELNILPAQTGGGHVSL